MKYFERTGDFTASLKFKEVFEDLLEAVGTHLPVDFVNRFYEETQKDLTAEPLPLKFRFDFELFEGQSYSVPVRTDEFDIGTKLDEVRQHDWVPMMRAFLLIFACLFFVMGIFNLVFKVS